MTLRFRCMFFCLLTGLAVALVGTPAFAQEGYVLDGFGGVHSINGAMTITPATPYFGFDVAESIQVLPGGEGYYVLDAFGGLHAGGTAPTPTPPPYFGFDIARDMSLVPTASSTMVVASPGSFSNVNGSATQFQSLFGTSFSGTAIGAGNFVPISCTAGNFAVSTSTTAGSPRPMVGSETATMTVMVNEVATALSCTLTAGQSSCADNSTVNISAGDRVGYTIEYSNLDTSSNGTFYFHKGFTCS